MCCNSPSGPVRGGASLGRPGSIHRAPDRVNEPAPRRGPTFSCAAVDDGANLPPPAGSRDRQHKVSVLDSFEWNKMFGALLLCALVVIVIDKAADIVMPEQQAGDEGQAAAEPAVAEEAETVTVEETADAGDSPTGETDIAAVASETMLDRTDSPDIAAVASETALDGDATPDADTAAGETPAEEPEPVVVAAIAVASTDDGKKLFRSSNCFACHTVDEGGGRRAGPNLWGVVGAQIAAREGFKFSDGLSGVGGIWDEAALDAWLADPKGFAPGNKMIFGGVKDADARANLIAYLKSLSS